MDWQAVARQVLEAGPKRARGQAGFDMCLAADPAQGNVSIFGPFRDRHTGKMGGVRLL